MGLGLPLLLPGGEGMQALALSPAARSGETSSGLVVLQVEDDSHMPSTWLDWPEAHCAWTSPLFHPGLSAPRPACEGPWTVTSRLTQLEISRASRGERRLR